MLGIHRRYILGHRNSKNDGMYMLKNFSSNFLNRNLRDSYGVTIISPIGKTARDSLQETFYEGRVTLAGKRFATGTPLPA